MADTKVGLLVLALTSGCLRLGYDATPSHQKPDAAVQDAGAHNVDGGTRDAGHSDSGKSSARPAAGGGGAGGGRAGAGGSGGSAAAGGSGGSSAADDDAGTGIDVDQMLGDTGLLVHDILGFYSNMSWGDMVLRTHGDGIWGVYNYDGGTIVGQLTADGVFQGWWSQSPTRTGRDAGEVEFHWLQENGITKLDGRWRYGTYGAWYENWDVELVTDRTAPSTLTDRFDDPSNFRSHP